MERELIMLVDDDEAIRTALTELLESEGYRVVAAPDGREALACLSRRELPQVILLDLMMPGTDGWKFRAEQMVNPALASIPVIVITAVASADRTGNLGVAVLPKPLDTGALLATIRKHCPHRRPQHVPVTSASPVLPSE
jgi:two-component system, chemotaxis family, chemotaxis protein CheY